LLPNDFCSLRGAPQEKEETGSPDRQTARGSQEEED